MPINPEITENIIDLIESTVEGAEYALQCYQSGKDNTFESLVSDITIAVESIKDTLNPYGDELTGECFNIIDNITASIENMKDDISNGNRRHGEIILEFEIIPLLLELKEDLYFFTLVYPEKERMGKYYKEEFVNNHVNKYVRDGKTQFDVSIVVLAWNKLDYTKLCLDSLFKYTDLKSFNCELITINHGSEDGTKEFFDSLPHEKKINLKKNMGMVIYTYMQRVVEGRYIICVSNDVILTNNWLGNLLACMKSDETVAMAVPSTSNTSNEQSIATDYKNLSQMQDFARSYNVSDPYKWEERIRLCPPIYIADMEIVNKTGFADRYFRFLEFSDDNGSTLFRRNGYKQMLLLDTFCHHFGSVTLGDAQRKNNTLEKSRQLFIEKYSIDPWGTGFCYDKNVINSLDFSAAGHIDILGIDAGLGATPLQIKNMFRHKGNLDVSLYNFSQEETYVPDLEPYSDYFLLDKAESLGHAFGETSFDFIYIGKNLSYYKEYKNLVSILRKRLKEHGRLVFCVNNFFSLESINRLVHFQLSNDQSNLVWIDPLKFLADLKKEFSHADFSLVQRVITPDLQPLYQFVMEANNNSSDKARILQTQYFQYILEK